MIAADLLALAERCEQAAGADRALDWAAYEAIGAPTWYDPSCPEVKQHWASRYTASLDAAMTLVPDGWHSSICTTEGAELRGSAALRDRNGGASFTAAAATPALALTAAALRARAATMGGDK